MKIIKDNLGNRMKEYENVAKHYLMKKTPVIIRIDGRHFHSFTKGMNKPFDKILSETMEETTKELFKNVQNCILAYTQSDEISLLLIDTKELNTEAYFSNGIQKMASVTAAEATLLFNKILMNKIELMITENGPWSKEMCLDKLHKAMFDSRVINVPIDDVPNYFVWRQMDCYKNAISSIAQSKFSHKELHCKNTNDKIQMIGPEDMKKYKDYLYGTLFYQDINMDNNQKIKKSNNKYDYYTLANMIANKGE